MGISKNVRISTYYKLFTLLMLNKERKTNTIIVYLLLTFGKRFIWRSIFSWKNWRKSD